MKLVLLNDFRNPVFFEHRDVFSAEHEILVMVEKRIKMKPLTITYADYHDMVGDPVLGMYFYLNGVSLLYRDFIDLVTIPGTSPNIFLWFRARIIEVKIETLDDWFTQRREGHSWSNLIHSTLKNSVDISLDKL